MSAERVATRLHDPFPNVLHPNTSLWELSVPFEYRVGHVNSSDVIIVAKGFHTDFASIPRLVRWAFPKNQIVALPPVIHDWLYATHERSRKEADDIFYEAMIAARYDRIRAWAQYRAVRTGGKAGYEWKSPAQFKTRTPKLFEKFYVG